MLFRVPGLWALEVKYLWLVFLIKKAEILQGQKGVEYTVKDLPPPSFLLPRDDFCLLLV